MVHGKVALKTETNITKYELNQTHKLLSVVDRLYSRFISKNIIYEINQISRRLIIFQNEIVIIFQNSVGFGIKRAV